VGTAAPQVYISSDVVQAGSIGVVATHIDVSKAEEQRGLKTTEIVAGRYKRIASQHAPLSAEGRQTLRIRSITSTRYSWARSHAIAARLPSK